MPMDKDFFTIASADASRGDLTDKYRTRWIEESLDIEGAERNRLSVAHTTRYLGTSISVRAINVFLTTIIIGLVLIFSRVFYLQIINGDYNNELSFKSFSSLEHVSLDSNKFDLVISATSLSEYGIPQKIFPFVNRILKKNGLFLIIGIKDNIIGYISNLIWDFKRLGKRDLIKQFQKSNFSHIQNHKIFWRFFPMNLMKFAISGRKS